MSKQTKFAVQDRNTGKFFAGLWGISDVNWTHDRDETYQMSRGQCQKVIDKLAKEGQDCRPQIVAVYK